LALPRRRGEELWDKGKKPMGREFLKKNPEKRKESAKKKKTIGRSRSWEGRVLPRSRRLSPVLRHLSTQKERASEEFRCPLFL